MTVLHRARGWSAVLKARPLRRGLPGDSPALVKALHELNAAGMLSPNHLDRFYPSGSPTSAAPCPRCGRLTAVEPWGIPSVCTACRAEWVSERVNLGTTAAPADGQLVCEVWSAGRAVQAAVGRGVRHRPCPDPARYPEGVYCAKHAKKMTLKGARS